MFNLTVFSEMNIFQIVSIMANKLCFNKLSNKPYLLGIPPVTGSCVK
jgi:hypothetical protein